jgi:Protein of unknown function (DUF1207)
MTKLPYYILFCAALALAFLNLYAETSEWSASAPTFYYNDFASIDPQIKQCPCGCNCGPHCNCGCREGKTCACSTASVASQPSAAYENDASQPYTAYHTPQSSAAYENDASQSSAAYENDASQSSAAYENDASQPYTAYHTPQYSAAYHTPQSSAAYKNDTPQPYTAYHTPQYSAAYENEASQPYAAYEHPYLEETSNTTCECQDSAPPVTHLYDGYDSELAESCGRSGVWLPEDPVLYRPMIADPRQIAYSVGWRFNDQVLVKNTIDVSFGDSVAFYRWCHAWPFGGELQIELEGALWAVFDPLHDSSPLMNADYYGGIPITYAVGDWEFRLRFYHISSHIGDEFLMDHPGFDRRNASAEFVDFFASNDLTDEIRLYGGLRYIVAQDNEFKCSRFSVQWGTELRVSQLGFLDSCENLYGEPFLAMNFCWTKDYKHHLDQTYVLGYEWGKLSGLCRKLRLYIEYHDGYSLEGQFCKQATNYFSIRTQYGY